MTTQPTGPLAPVDPQPILGLHGEPCASCGSPLAADQRYCLDCGARRADARLPFRDILAATPHAATVPTAPATPQARTGGDGSRGGTLAALAGLGVLLLALGAGVLIGQAGGEASQRATTPQVINLGGAAGTGAAGAGASGTPAAKSSSSSKKPRDSGASSRSSSGAKSSNPSIKKLEKLSPQQYQKQSQKLPKVVGTGGKPPPKDNKAPAGGGDFETIG